MYNKNKEYNKPVSYQTASSGHLLHENQKINNLSRSFIHQATNLERHVLKEVRHTIVSLVLVS